MSHFYGTLCGSRGQATRCGTKHSGIVTIAASWGGAIRVDLTHNVPTETDIFTVELIPWENVGCTQLLAEGIVGTPSHALTTHGTPGHKQPYLTNHNLNRTAQPLSA